MNFIDVVNNFIYTKQFLKKYDEALHFREFPLIFRTIHYKNHNNYIRSFPMFLSLVDRSNVLGTYK